MPAMTAIRCEGLCAMERKLMDRLLAWKDDAHRRALVLTRGTPDRQDMAFGGVWQTSVQIHGAN